MSEKTFTQCIFDGSKERFLRFADTVRKANTAEELRAMLMADTEAPHHSYDILLLMDAVENIGHELCEVMSEGLDQHGVPIGGNE